MLKKQILIFSTLAALLILPAISAHAQMAIGIKGGSTGIGAELTKGLTKKINVRASGTFFNYTTNGVYADDEPSIAYDMEGSMTSLGILVDFFPAKRWFKVSAGVHYHDFLIDGGATPNESYSIDDKTFAPEKLGSLSAKVEYESKIVPYAGLGLGNPVAVGSRIKFNFEIGAMYTDAPTVTMEGEGMIGPTANQDASFNDGLKDFKFYPVINFGLSFRL